MSDYEIPFNRPWLTGHESSYLNRVFAEGRLSGDGTWSKRCQALLEEELGAAKVLLTPSGTHALDLAALLLEAGPNDEFVVPSFTFPSTANAFVLRGAKPVFADIRPDTLNLDESHLKEVITDATAVVVPVHYAGIACEMDQIMDICADHAASVLEDNALGLFGRYHGKLLGTFGSLAALSFHETKSFSAGEGGALIINDPRYIMRAEILREKGTDRSKFSRGEVDKYTWVDIGSSYLPSEVTAALLMAQLDARAEVIRSRKRIWDFYHGHLRDWAEKSDVLLPHVPEGSDPAYSMFHVVLPSESDRNELIGRLRSRGILGVWHYQPLHLSPMGKRFGGTRGQLPVSESVSARLLRLPFYNDLTERELERIVEVLQR